MPSAFFSPTPFPPRSHRAGPGCAGAERPWVRPAPCRLPTAVQGAARPSPHPIAGGTAGPAPHPRAAPPFCVVFFSPSPRFAEPCRGDASCPHLCLRAELSPWSPSGGAWEIKGVRASAVGEQTSAVCASGDLFLILFFFFLRSHQISIALSDGSKQIHEVEVCFLSSLLFI